jgi:hypothetical protein
LEKVFCREIDGFLPFQSRSKTAKRLAELGYLSEYTRTFTPDRFGSVTISGYELTHLGRLAYCMSCPEEEEETNLTRKESE